MMMTYLSSVESPSCVDTLQNVRACVDADVRPFTVTEAYSLSQSLF